MTRRLKLSKPESLHDEVNRAIVETLDRCNPFVNIWSGGANARFDTGENKVSIFFSSTDAGWTLKSVYFRQKVATPRWWGTTHDVVEIEATLHTPMPVSEEVINTMTRKLDQQTNATEALQKIEDARLLRRLIEALRSL